MAVRIRAALVLYARGLPLRRPPPCCAGRLHPQPLVRCTLAGALSTASRMRLRCVGPRPRPVRAAAPAAPLPVWCAAPRLVCALPCTRCLGACLWLGRPVPHLCRQHPASVLSVFTLGSAGLVRRYTPYSKLMHAAGDSRARCLWHVRCCGRRRGTWTLPRPGFAPVPRFLLGRPGLAATASRPLVGLPQRLLPYRLGTVSAGSMFPRGRFADGFGAFRPRFLLVRASCVRSVGVHLVAVDLVAGFGGAAPVWCPAALSGRRVSPAVARICFLPLQPVR